MASIIESASFRKLVEGHIKNVKQQTYKDIPSYKDRLFKVMSSDSAYEDFFSIGTVPDIPAFTGRINYLPVFSGYYTKIEPKEFSGGLLFQRKLLDDEQYGVLSNRAAWLMRAARRTEIKAEMHSLVYAFSAAFEYMTSEEGVALCSTGHLTKSGASTSVGFNNLSTAALSKTAVAAARLKMRLFRDDLGERIDVGDDLMLIVPDNLHETAYEIVKTPKSLDTAEGNVNFQYQRYDLLVLPRLDDYSTSNWYLTWKSQMKEDHLWVDRIKPEPKNTWDFETYTLKLAMYFRFAYGFKDWRFILGSQVS
jgi:phage major head subunit gpT-like protein